MAGHTYRLQQLPEGAWLVATVDADRAWAREFPTEDDALLWRARQNPLAILMPDHVFVPTAQGSGVERSADHSVLEA
ncbi:MAG: hypothetical protein H0X45_08295 [Planctomycetes bacterium]|nr:hypothetical protein [Planctomycetota bacterium]